MRPKVSRRPMDMVVGPLSSGILKVHFRKRLNSRYETALETEIMIMGHREELKAQSLDQRAPRTRDTAEQLWDQQNKREV